MEEIDVAVVGGGQAGIAMSEHLSAHGLSHLVLEKDRIAERWRSGRWDSLVMNGPAWHDRFPGLDFDSDPDGFPGKEEVAAYFEAYVDKFDVPIRCGVEVRRAIRKGGGFQITTNEGEIAARNIVAATGPFQRPIIPPIVPEGKGPPQIHSAAYRNPSQLPEGAVLVVGAGSSGVQIAEELSQAGRRVYLSVGPHDRPPRRYRGRDFVWWLGVLGKWDMETPAAGAEHVTIAVSGAEGGKTVDFRRLAASGITLVGMTQSFADGVMSFADDLAANIQKGDANHLSVLREADAYIAATGIDLPEEPQAHLIGPDPACMTDPVGDLDLAEAGVGAIIWATGYAVDYGWLEVDALDENGRPRHKRGVSAAPGVYFLGLPWQSRRGSSFIWGVWHDARFVADQIAIRSGYLNHHRQNAPLPV